MRRGKLLGKAGASSVFDSITITEFVNQHLLFSFSSSLSIVGRKQAMPAKSGKRVY